MSPCWTEGWAGLSCTFIDIPTLLADMLYSALELLQSTGVFLNTKRLLLLAARMGPSASKPGMPVDGLLGTTVVSYPCFAHILMSGVWRGMGGPELAASVLHGN